MSLGTWNIILLIIVIVLIILSIVGLNHRLAKFRSSHIESKINMESNETEVNLMDASPTKRPLSDKKSGAETKDEIDPRDKNLIPKIPMALATAGRLPDDSEIYGKTDKSIDFFIASSSKRGVNDVNNPSSSRGKMAVPNLNSAKNLPEHEKNQIIDHHVERKNRELSSHSDWKLFKQHYEAEATDHNFLCWCCDKKRFKMVTFLDHLMFNSSLYELMIFLSCLIIASLNSSYFSDGRQIGFVTLVMFGLLVFVLCSVRHAKLIHMRAKNAKKYNAEDPGEEKVLLHVSQAQAKFGSKVKTLLLFMLGLSAGVLGIYEATNITNQQAGNVLIAIGLAFILDMLIVRNIVVLCIALTRVCCCRKHYINEKSEEAVHLQLNSLNEIPAEDERFVSKRGMDMEVTRRNTDIEELDKKAENIDRQRSDLSFQVDPEAKRLSPDASLNDIPRKNSREIEIPVRKGPTKVLSTANSIESLDLIDDKPNNQNINAKAIPYRAEFAKGKPHTDEPAPKKRKVQGNKQTGSDEDDEDGDNTQNMDYDNNYSSNKKFNSNPREDSIQLDFEPNEQIRRDNNDSVGSLESKLNKMRPPPREDNKINKRAFAMGNDDDYNPRGKQNTRETGDSWMKDDFSNRKGGLGGSKKNTNPSWLNDY